ncbi:glycosyltransferase family protein (plasmid) [Candidatus Photodesmus blepharus]|uniref:Glycosyltransferase family protein n=1 Tax=Candidatus Photodesmus blepharonis TaxID=1179155 RepID=A0A084CNW7_9GAMM|nr:glycosyltransferase family 2 protein [Candidatus Photodesmus blepharus]KEY91496.1 glycosyltransferase family protein [Candidatus Photodesmus blepharus]
MICSIVVPCYNEEKNIESLIDKFKLLNNGSFELIMVNNGSKDNTLKMIEKEAKNYTFIKIVNIHINKGYGNGILNGLENATGDILGWTHADLQTDPLDIKNGLDLVKKNSNIKNIYIKGRRKNRSFHDSFFTFFMSVFESILLKEKLYDINAQPNLFHRDFYLRIRDNAPKDFSLDLYFYYMALKNKLEIKKFNVLFPDRIHGYSSWNNSLKSKYKFIKRTINFSFKLKRMIK